MADISLYREMNDKIADMLLDCGDNGMCLYAGAYIKSLERQLRGYKSLEGQNKLLRLPCAVGDTVYSPIVDEFEGEKLGFIAESTVEDVSVKGVTFAGLFVPWGEFGRMDFLTRAEAEQGLRRMKGEEEAG